MNMSVQASEVTPTTAPPVEGEPGVQAGGSPTPEVYTGPTPPPSNQSDGGGTENPGLSQPSSESFGVTSFTTMIAVIMNELRAADRETWNAGIDRTKDLGYKAAQHAKTSGILTAVGSGVQGAAQSGASLKGLSKLNTLSEKPRAQYEAYKDSFPQKKADAHEALKKDWFDTDADGNSTLKAGHTEAEFKFAQTQLDHELEREFDGKKWEWESNLREAQETSQVYSAAGQGIGLTANMAFAIPAAAQQADATETETDKAVLEQQQNLRMSDMNDRSSFMASLNQARESMVAAQTGAINAVWG